MLLLSYAICALLVILLSIKLSDYVDLLDKKTNLSGAFLGGVMLAAVTSLPELFTSISAVVFLNEPELVIGNILGSDLFNVTALSTVSLLGFKTVSHTQVARSHSTTVIFTLIIYALLACVALDLFHIYFFGVNIASFLIVVLYALGVRSLSSDEGVAENEDTASDLTARQLLLRFALLSCLLVTVSICLTFITDRLNARYQLGASFAGAVFLGIATSLPELVSTIQLVRLNNFNAACGNILGSNLFNFIILAIADLLYTAGTIYIFDYQSYVLLACGTLASVAMMCFVVYNRSNVLSRSKQRSTALNLLFLAVGFACYVAFLLLTV
jgi:cation:H+ antiporter